MKPKKKSSRKLTTQTLAKRMLAVQKKRVAAQQRIRKIESQLDKLDKTMTQILQDAVQCV